MKQRTNTLVNIIDVIFLFMFAVILLIVAYSRKVLFKPIDKVKAIMND